MRRVLLRRIDRWARAQTDPDASRTDPLRAARGAVDEVVRRLAEAGAISDAHFAESRARSLVRSGQSNRSIQMRLVAKGVAPTWRVRCRPRTRRRSWRRHLVLARKRRIGPYRVAEDVDAAVRFKEMALLARAGFSRDIARQALETSREDAEARIFELRR